MSSHRASLSGNVLKIAGYKHQADAVLSQANPVSTTLYTVLGTTRNVRIISIQTAIAWAANQPTLAVILTIDGIPITYSLALPVSGTNYMAKHIVYSSEANQSLTTCSDLTSGLFIEGRSVKVEVTTTWAVTQPTPLVCRVKYAKIP